MKISYFYIVSKSFQQNCSNFITFNLRIMMLKDGHNLVLCHKCIFDNLISRHILMDAKLYFDSLLP